MPKSAKNVPGHAWKRSMSKEMESWVGGTLNSHSPAFINKSTVAKCTG